VDFILTAVKTHLAMIGTSTNILIHTMIGFIGIWMIYKKNRSIGAKNGSSTASSKNGTGIKDFAILVMLPGLFAALKSSNGAFDGDVIGRVVWGLAWASGVVLFFAYAYTGLRDKR
jgi:hypothetical protein